MKVTIRCRWGYCSDPGNAFFDKNTGERFTRDGQRIASRAKVHPFTLLTSFTLLTHVDPENLPVDEIIDWEQLPNELLVEQDPINWMLNELL